MNIQMARAIGFKVLSPITDTAALDTRVLLCNVLGMTEIQLFASDRELSDEEEIRFRSLLCQRSEGVPVAYLTGRKEFFGRDFQVSPDTLIPRPDTEILVEKALEFAVSSFPSGGCSLLDICTGTGCIGITLAAELAAKGIDATLALGDISPGALEIAENNCRQIIKNGAKCILSNLFEAFDGEKFDLITANPPYIAPAFRETLPREVRKEPELALFAGENGMALVRKIVRDGGNHLNPGGLLIIECDSSQTGEAVGLLRGAGFGDCFELQDLSGLSRCVGGFWNA